jgi:hypothetical protein
VIAAPKVWLIAGSLIGLAAFNAELPAAREHMVRTDPGSLSAASVPRTHGESNPPPPRHPPPTADAPAAAGGDATAASPQAEQTGQPAAAGQQAHQHRQATEAGVSGQRHQGDGGLSE